MSRRSPCTFARAPLQVSHGNHRKFGNTPLTVTVLLFLFGYTGWSKKIAKLLVGQSKNCTQEIHKTSHNIFPTCLQSPCEFSKQILYYATKLAQFLWTLYLLTLGVTSVTLEKPFLPYAHNVTAPGGAEWKTLCGILTLEFKPETE